MTREQIEDRVAQALVQALGVSRDRVTPSASLVGDLEAESIDFLDLVFRLEKDFGIEIPRGELFPQELLRRLDKVGVERTRQPLVGGDQQKVHPSFGTLASNREQDRRRVGRVHSRFIDQRLRRAVGVMDRESADPPL